MFLDRNGYGERVLFRIWHREPGRSKNVTEACELSMQALSNYQLDLPFGLIYLIDGAGKRACLAANAYLPPGTPASPEFIELDESTGSAWSLKEVIRTGATSTISGLVDRFGNVNCEPYPESPETALVVPIAVAGADRPAVFLIAGVSPRLPFAEDYQTFFDLIGAALTAAIVNARAYEQERMRAEKLAELNQAKTAFFSKVSHEFRTPLTLMLGPIEEIL